MLGLALADLVSAANSNMFSDTFTDLDVYPLRPNLAWHIAPDFIHG